MHIDERVRADLASRTRFNDIRLLEVTDSTNRVVADLAADGAAEGVVVAADLQTAGRGRLDRTWEAQPGSGLLVSVLLRPTTLPLSRWHLVTEAAGLAARDGCVEVSGFRPELKWPNDLISDDGKLAGILAESTSGAAVVGMGLNVHSGPPGSAWLDHLAGVTVSRPDLLVAWLRSFDRFLDDWELVSSRYRSECSTVGKVVEVELAGGRLTGTAESIDEEGRLVVRQAGGRDGAGAGAALVVVSAGDVVHVRPA